MRGLSGALLLLVCGCSNQPVKQPAGPRDLTMSTRELWAGDQLKLLTRTNLPDGAQLLATINAPNGAMLGQDDAYVVGGVARFGPFAQAVRGRSATISAPLSDIQPVEVQEIVGNNYANYRSPLLVKHDLGTVIEAEVPLTPPR